MIKNILHLIDSVDRVNFGIWNAALAQSTYLTQMGYTIYAAYPKAEFSYDGVENAPFTSIDAVKSFLVSEELTKANTMVISHGCWRWASTFGIELKSKGYAWMAVPHGMLEPWSMKQKALKKKLYWHLLEKRRLKNADFIRAVSRPEFGNLKPIFGSKTLVIPNGVDLPEGEFLKDDSFICLYMARLHHKKGITPLVKAWKASAMAGRKDAKLLIAGPDDGELKSLNSLLAPELNVQYIGAIYGKEKDALLRKSSVYILPSHSEGFPSSVVEAMSYGLWPVISEGCNFPEALEAGVAQKVSVEYGDILDMLNSLYDRTKTDINKQGLSSREFVAQSYTNKKVARMLDQLIRSLHA